MFDEIQLLRCAPHEPILPDAIRQLAATVAVTDQVPLLVLAKGLDRRTTLRPEAVSRSALGVALECLLGQMLDRDTFMRQHEQALRYFAIVV